MKKITPFITSFYVIDITPVSFLSEIYDVKSKIKSNNLSNKGGWQSPAYTNEHDFILNFYKESIEENLIQIYKEHRVSHKPKLGDYWFNVNGKYNYNSRHWHPFSYFSGVLYLQVPKDSGNIIFHRPDNYDSYIPIFEHNENNYGSWWYPPSVNQFIIFPSYLHHEVTQNLSNEDRVSVAFNFIGDE